MAEADTSDQATRLEELARQSAMFTSRRPAGPEPTGYCLWCDEPIGMQRRWCCPQCRDSWEKLSK